MFNQVVVKMYQSTNGLPPLMKHLMRENLDAFPNIIKETSDSFLNLSSIDIILEILKKLESCKDNAHEELLISLKDSADRNLFHICAQRKANDLFEYLWNCLHRTERSYQTLAKDKANKTPFILMASSKNVYCHSVWEDFEYLLDINVHLQIDQLFKQEPQTQDTILHICGKVGNYDLLSKICQSRQVDGYVKATMTSTNTPMITINNEKILQNMVRTFDWSKFHDCQKAIFHHICQKDFNASLHLIKRSIKFEPFLDLLLSRGIFI